MEAVRDEADWRHWFREYGPRLLLCARQWTRSQADAEDVVQEAFVRYWKNQHGRVAGPPLALLLTAVRRAAFDRYRSDGRRNDRELRLVAEQDEAWFDADPGADDRRRVLEQAVARLPEAQREVLVLKLWGELTFAEIAQQLGVPANTAASRYRYALETLRQQLSAADCHG